MNKRIWFAIIGLSISVGTIHAQGIRVIYHEKMSAPVGMGDLDNPAIAAAVMSQLQKMNKTMVLYCEQGTSFYDQFDKKGDEQSGFKSNVQTIQMGGGGTVFKSQKEKECISQEVILDKQFLITEPLHQKEWSLTEGEKTVAGYACKKATFGENIVAWYCPEIPVNDGPYLYWGLPGLILELEMPAKTITAQVVDLKFDTTGKINSPVTGKKVTREEFEKTRKEKMGKMGVDEGGSGIKVIRLQ